MRVPKPSVSRSPSASVNHRTAASVSRGIALQIFLEGCGRFKRRGIVRDGDRRRSYRRREIAQQGRETQVRVQHAQRFDVRIAAREIIEHQLHRRIRINDRELLGHQHRVAAVLQRLAIALAFDFHRALQRRLRRTKALDKFFRAFFPNAFRAGDVVDRVAHQRHYVSDFVRRHAHQFFDF